MTNLKSANFPNFQFIAPPHTPFNSDGSLNLAQIALQAEWFDRTGVNGVFVGGSTGEGLSLTVAERKAVAEEWCRVARSHGLKTFIHVGHNSQQEAIGMARHADAIGADAIAVLPPFYFRPQNVDQLIDFIQPIAAAAANLRVYYYEIPALTEVRLPLTEFLEKSATRIPNLSGVKYTNTDLVQLQECLHSKRQRWDMFFGVDEALLAGYSLGVRGAIGSTYNFMAPFFRKLIADADEGDRSSAQSKQAQVVALCRLLQQVSFVSACKCIMKMLGIDCGPVRAPLQNLSVSQQQRLIAELEPFKIFSIELDESKLTA